MQKLQKVSEIGLYSHTLKPHSDYVLVLDGVTCILIRRTNLYHSSITESVESLECLGWNVCLLK
jgi:hypothetical protein